MKRQDFSFDLPASQIAKQPCAQREQSRLLCLDPVGQVSHRTFYQIQELLKPDDLLVFNDTRVIPARLFGHKESGGKIELLVERVLDSTRMISQIRASKAPKTGSKLVLDQNAVLLVESREEGFFTLQLDACSQDESIMSVLERLGHMPLPPYIDRDDALEDRERYQTVYAKKSGAVAAPTAGLHFSRTLLESIESMGVQTAFVTLHVGAGTFQPMRADDIHDHTMHREYVEVDAKVCQKIEETRAKGGRVIAVGTTTVRSLESAAQSGQLKPFSGETDIFIYPGYEFKTIDAMVTNFHLPESTLLMLVCAFAGYHETLGAYRIAVEQAYRFFSYGDAMFVERSTEPSLPEEQC